jgi:hypothetical protein
MMIPASYLFQDVFRQSFYDPDIADAIQRHREHRGPGLFARLRRRHQQTAPALPGVGVRAPAEAG